MNIIETRSRSNILSWILYGICSITFLISSFVVLIKIIFENFKNTDSLLPVFMILLMVGILSLRMFLWFIKGKESVIINNNCLQIKRSGTFWIKNEKRFLLNEIKNLTITKNFYEENSPSELVGIFSRQMYIFKIQNTGRVKIVFENYNTYRFLDNLDIDQAQEIIEKIKTVGNITYK